VKGCGVCEREENSVPYPIVVDWCWVPARVCKVLDECPRAIWTISQPDGPFDPERVDRVPALFIVQGSGSGSGSG
jgi:hypothetical protein